MSQIPAQYSAAALSLLIDGARYPEPSVQAALETARVRVAEPFLHSARVALRNTDDGLRMGAMLNDLKGQLPYGEFDRFVERMGIKKNTANRWMRLARGGPQKAPHNTVQKVTGGLLQPDVVGSIGKANAGVDGTPPDMLDPSELDGTAMADDGLPPVEEDGVDTEGWEDEYDFEDDGDDAGDGGGGDAESIVGQIADLKRDCQDSIDRIDAALKSRPPSPDGRGDQDAAAAAGAVSDLKGAVVPGGFGLGGVPHVSDTLATIEGVGKKRGEPAAATTLPSRMAPAVQLTLAGEYEAIDRTRRAFDELVQGVLARVRDGRVSLATGHRVADVLEAAGMEIESLVRVCAGESTTGQHARDGVADHAVQAV